MHLSDGRASSVGGGCSTPGGSVEVRQGMWRVIPETGQVSLSDQALQTLINTDPIEKWYDIDPEPIASGQFAMVYHCRHRTTGEEFAAKFSSRRRLGSDASSAIIHEITVNAILTSCVRNIKLRDVFTTEQSFILIMEYAPGGDLQTLVDENVVFYERHVISFLRQLLEGLVFIHDRSLVHLDIKPQNLVLMGDFPDCAVKLCDFEISRLLTPGYEVREIRGTPDYVAPEILHYEPITTKTDMWSLGVLTYVLLTGYLPFGGDSDQETFMQISWGELDFPNELFEDITSEAIDFMKKLLIREPEQRMSARECLNHPWIQNSTAPENNNSPKTTESTNLTTEVLDNTERSTETTVPSNPEESKTTIDENAQQTNQQIIGRPPLHPRTSQKSLNGVPGDLPSPVNPVVPLPAITPFLNKESRLGSRQNLNRLRSMSKSREVLSERIQMSNLKKNLSKSRERLFDARLGLSTSRDDLMNCKILSQSVEALTALSQLHQNGALYKSCNNIFIPVIHLVNKEQEMQDRMYKSLASIDKIPGNDLCPKMGYFESRFTTDEDLNDAITQRNTNMNIVITDSPLVESNGFDTDSEDFIKYGVLRGNTCRGGRSAEGCDRICSRLSHKQPEPQSTQKIRKLSKSEKMKKDAQKRRKEKKEQEAKDRQRKASLGDNSNKNEKTASENSSPPAIRRGSVCHVEQRLQERHERMMERQEREERKLSVGGNNRRLSSVDLEKSPLSERRKSHGKTTLSVDDGRPRSITPSRRRKSSKSESSKGSDVSQASSMESVTGSLEDVQNNQKPQRKRSKYSTPSAQVKSNATVEKVEKNMNDVNDNLISTSTQLAESTCTKESDEAYVSLEENCKDIYQLSEENKNEIDSTNFNDNNTSTLNSSTNKTPEKLAQLDTLTEIKTSSDESKLQTPSIVVPSSGTQVNDDRRERKRSQVLSDISDLSCIHEESTEQPKYTRSISTTSDLGSTISEESEDTEQVSTDMCEIERKIAENKQRVRSKSVHQNLSHNAFSGTSTRARSNSVHQSSADKARPWGELCSGSIAKALKNFSIQEDPDSHKQLSDIQKRRQSSPPLS